MNSSRKIFEKGLYSWKKITLVLVGLDELYSLSVCSVVQGFCSMCCLKKALCAVKEWWHTLKNCSATGIHLHADSLLFLLLTQHLLNCPFVDTEKPQLSAFLCFMTAASLFYVPVHNKAIENTIFNKCGR